jgi:HlyD family secretion protein
LTAINLEDDLSLSEGTWRGRIITLLLALIGLAAVAAAIYYFALRDDSTTLSRSTEEIPVTRATISQTLTISGVADAQLSSNLTFQASGKIAFVGVKVGDPVSEGDVLASLQSDDLSNAVQQAQANQQAAQLKLSDLLDGPTASEVAAADQGVASAQAALTKAQNDYTTLTSGGTASDISAAEQGVHAAEAQLASATATRQKLQDTPSTADRAAAEAGVAAAQSALTAAQNSAASAGNTVTTADASLRSAENSYCAADTAPAFCTAQSAPISSADADLMDTALGGTHATLATGVISANSTYLNAVNGAASADASVTSAQQSLDSAQEKLTSVHPGPCTEAVAAADAAVTSAQASLTAAQDKLTTLQQGGTDAQRSSAAAAVASAQATLDAAVAKRDDTFAGATQNQIDQASQAVQTAALAVEAARIRLKNAQIIAPFDGVVAAVNARVGEFGGAAGGATATAAPIVLLTPDRLRLKMNVQETDYGSIKLDQGGVVLFDALPGKPFPFKINQIGSSPTSSQGVVTYEVDAALVLAPGGPAPAQGMNGRGLITTDSKANILVVPARAIKRRGSDQIVSVKRASGSVEEQVITTGASDANNVEVLTGLSEGDVVEVVTLTSAKPGAKPTAVPTIPGGLR